MNKASVLLLGVSSLAFSQYAVIGRPLHRFHLDKMKNNLRVEEAQNQERQFPGTIQAEKAVFLALRSFLKDASDIESPLALATQLALEELNLPFDKANNPCVVKRAKEILHVNLNRYTSELRFVSPDEKPEHGETVKRNWIIRLKIPTLSDHIFWAIVERSGAIAPYNYGFN